MKFHLILLILLSAAVVMTMAGCGLIADNPAEKDSQQEKTDADDSQSTPITPEQETKEDTINDPENNEIETNYDQVYGPVLDRFYEIISTGSDSHEAAEGETGVWEAIAGKKSSDALDCIGYTIQDISGDGIPELLIGAVPEANALSSGNEIYAVYTSINDAPHLSFDGWSRSSYRYLGENNFFNQGSNGAMYSIFGTYSISPDGKALSCTDFYFTYEKDENFEEIGFYHNTTGEWDTSVSEELKITDQEFWQIETELQNKIQCVDLIPFSAYMLSNGNINTDAPQVSVQWAEDALDEYNSYDEFCADTTESQVKVMFIADRLAKDFKVLALTLENVDENGKVTFSTQELYSLDALTPERPLVVGMTFYGDIPSYGISYVDESGTTRKYAVEISGDSGSLLISEF